MAMHLHFPLLILQVLLLTSAKQNTCAHVIVCACVCVYVCMCVYVCTRMCVYMCACVIPSPLVLRKRSVSR